jgi:hypothetical protein
LASCASLATLAVLGLSNNQIGDAEAAALAASPHLGRLTSLNLAENDIGDVGSEAIPRRWPFAVLWDRRFPP